MPRISGIRRLFRFPASADAVGRDVQNEIDFHVESRTQDLVSRGMDPKAARSAALQEFGDVREARAELENIGRRRVRHIRRSDWWSDLRQDVRYGVRSLLHAPLFSLLATVTLALGIGANAAIFSVVKSVLIDALPYADAGRLVRVYGRLLDGSMDRAPLSAGSVEEIGRRQRSFERMATYVDRADNAVYGGDDSPRIAKIVWVGPGFFETLGVSAARGRTFRDDEGTSGLVPLSGGQLAPDTARAVVVTDAAWGKLFAGAPDVVGREVRINGTVRTVIGVLPRGFIGPMGDGDFYLAFDPGPVASHPVSGRRSQWLGLTGRLRDGVSHEAAERELAAIGADLAREHPQDNGNFGVTGLPLHNAMVGDTRRPLIALMASAGLVLLIACANLAGALLSRTLSRRKEFAVRVALGAGRGRLVRQLLTESLLLALAGGGAGLALAAVGLSELRALTVAALPSYATPTLDAGAVVVMTLVAVGTGLAFGIAPALSVGRGQAQEALRDEGRGASASRRSRRIRGILVAGQMAVCVSLLAGAGLLARSLWAMAAAPLGFDPEGVLTLTLQLPVRDYPTREQLARFQEQFAERLRSLPGVNDVAQTTAVPTAVPSRVGFSIEGAAVSTDATPFALYASVSDTYFRTLRIPLRAGRTSTIAIAPTLLQAS